MHYGSPDKDPALRLAVIEDAGRERVPFTTGILVGIGETLRDRAESLVALRDAHERHGHVQEVIVQNFRAKPRTAMQGAPDAALLEYVAAVAVARLVMGPRMRIQVPPNLSDPAEFDLLRARRRRRLGRRLAAHRRPREPRAAVAAPRRPRGAHRRARLRAARAADGASRVRPRCRRPGSTRRCTPAVAALADPETGLARATRSARRDHSPRTAEIGAARRARRSGRDVASQRRDPRGSPRPRHPTRSRSTTPSGSRCSRRPATTSTRSPRPPTTCAATRSARP